MTYTKYCSSGEHQTLMPNPYRYVEVFDIPFGCIMTAGKHILPERLQAFGVNYTLERRPPDLPYALRFNTCRITKTVYLNEFGGPFENSNVTINNTYSYDEESLSVIAENLLNSTENLKNRLKTFRAAMAFQGQSVASYLSLQATFDICTSIIVYFILLAMIRQGQLLPYFAPTVIMRLPTVNGFDILNSTKVDFDLTERWESAVSFFNFDFSNLFDNPWQSISTALGFGKIVIAIIIIITALWLEWTRRIIVSSHLGEEKCSSRFKFYICFNALFRKKHWRTEYVESVTIFVPVKRDLIEGTVRLSVMNKFLSYYYDKKLETITFTEKLDMRGHFEDHTYSVIYIDDVKIRTNAVVWKDKHVPKCLEFDCFGQGLLEITNDPRLPRPPQTSLSIDN